VTVMAGESPVIDWVGGRFFFVLLTVLASVRWSVSMDAFDH